ncbi:MAG: hypothetical protein ACXQTS_06720 [Candidatus Methanospirareceae archaeon]
MTEAKLLKMENSRKCPICNKHIGKLKCYEIFTWSTVFERFRRYYCCPNCGEVLFDDEDEATKFLKTGKVPERKLSYFIARKLMRS